MKSEESNNLTLKGTFSNNYISNPRTLYQAINLESIMLEQIDINIGVFNLGCNDIAFLNLIELTTEGNIDCLLRMSPKDISQIKTDNGLLKSILDLVNLILIIKGKANTSEPQEVPVKFNLDKGLFYINAIPIYQFPKEY
tara:strand:- start:87 stop:506 length:420 start_codon:yes stop_codon:yes gene_type:complete